METREFDVFKSRKSRFKQTGGFKQKKLVHLLVEKCKEAELTPEYSSVLKQWLDSAPAISWNSLPLQLRPSNFMPKDRAARKCLQLENVLVCLRNILNAANQKSISLVDFCSSSGHFGFVAAYLFPQLRVTLVELNDVAAQKAVARKIQLRLSNIEIYHGNINAFQQSFDIGVGIHACGVLSDVILDKCIEQKAAFILVPCCVGKIPASLSNDERPRSQRIARILTSDMFARICSFGDYGETEQENIASSDDAGARRFCKSCIEFDRVLLAQEHGYQTHLCKLIPLSCTPKNDIIVGWFPK